MHYLPHGGDVGEARQVFGRGNPLDLPRGERLGRVAHGRSTRKGLSAASTPSKPTPLVPVHPAGNGTVVRAQSAIASDTAATPKENADRYPRMAICRTVSGAHSLPVRLGCPSAFSRSAIAAKLSRSPPRASALRGIQAGCHGCGLQIRVSELLPFWPASGSEIVVTRRLALARPTPVTVCRSGT